MQFRGVTAEGPQPVAATGVSHVVGSTRKELDRRAVVGRIMEEPRPGIQEQTRTQ
jgi:hypothetical protein